MAFTLAYESVAENAAPGAPVIVLHGILGRGRNWRSLCRKVARARPSLAFLLVDLRMHGDSQGAPPPHTFAAAVDDVRRLAQQTGTAAIIGHSFGGKVALALLAGEVPDSLREAWIIDASPGPPGDRLGNRQVDAALEALSSLPAGLRDRAAVIAELTARGLAPAVAAWLAQSFSPAEGGTLVGPDVEAIRAMLADHDAIDLWPVAEAPPVALRFVLGEKSDAVPAGDRARLAQSAARVDVIPGAGHWVHVDAPDAVADLFAQGLLSHEG